ncbi:phosphomannomutase/phosphoglucomutase [Egicoccus sp. AB-alg6-2]|uniref:phosphomannomutase/phosphoglucomutase n=1 Tax=Egicoccus sp. AB-alg6-2 TaxID=3242692 RepID=UPI00359E7F32
MPVSREILDAVVKAYDVRGLVGEQLDADFARAFGAATAEVLLPEGGRLVVGYDMRPSSPGLAHAFADGVNSRGVDVVDIGLASTDQLYYASGVLDAAGAMFTASHNPAAYNGIKLCRPGAVPVAIDTGLGDIRDLAVAVDGLPPAEPGRRSEDDLTDRFAAHVRSFVDTAALREVSVVVDAGNGMAGHVWPAVVDGLPIRTTPLFFELDGSFPNHPANPLEPENLRDLQAEVRRGGHALGLAFDGDADRVFAVDEEGRPVSSSLIGAVVADRLLARHPGATVLYNLICSRTVPETIEAAGGRAVRTRVGHSFIKRRMAETDAVYAVEHSGHYYFRDNFRADSGVIAALVLLEAVADAGAPLSQVVAPYDRYAASGELNYEVADQQAALQRVADAFADRGRCDTEDGLTVVTAGGWFNLRPSNTEPLLRLNVEADDADAMARLRDEVAALATSA